MNVLIDDGRRAAYATVDSAPAAFQAHDSYEVSVGARQSVGSVKEIRATVEVLRRIGGLAPFALLGGRYVPWPEGDHNPSLVLIVATVPEDELSRQAPSCPTRLSVAGSVVPGIPAEYAKAIAAAVAYESSLGSGHLVLDRGGYDPVNSSASVFALAAKVLAAVLGAGGVGAPGVEASARRALES